MVLIVTQSKDSFQITKDGVDFKAKDEVLTILKNVIVESVDLAGVVSAFSDSDLINQGIVISIKNSAAYFLGADAAMTNGITGLIRGYHDGIDLNGAGIQSVFNDGKILGKTNDGVFVDSFAQGVQLNNNHGQIVGRFAGILNSSFHSGGKFHNSGLIKGHDAGIYLSTGGQKTTITNEAGGVIQGADAIYIFTGKVHLTNDGTMIGNIVDTFNEHNVIINHGNIKGLVQFGGGNDVFNGTGGTSGKIGCGSGDDRVIGGMGKVVIDVGTGNNTLTAGPGADRFAFDSALGSQVDTITNFKPGADKIVLKATDFMGIGLIDGTLVTADFHLNAPVGGGPQIVYTRSDGFLYYDENGGALTGAKHFATLASHPIIHHTDFLVVA